MSDIKDKIEILTKWDSRINGTSLSGYLHGSLNEVVALFGEPLGGDDVDGYKTDAEWMMVIDGKDPVTIYNYKNGKNYNGEDGLDVTEMDEWHIGSKTVSAVWKLQRYLDEAGSPCGISVS